MGMSPSRSLKWTWPTGRTCAEDFLNSTSAVDAVLLNRYTLTMPRESVAWIRDGMTMLALL